MPFFLLLYFNKENAHRKLESIINEGINSSSLRHVKKKNCLPQC
uniref:Bm1353 n=1 Tax=Brugia malayi TaxID=6279 RepID=A0A1I9G2P2_BRUMA|nr:Bm1353 [Brugia malayi]